MEEDDNDRLFGYAEIVKNQVSEICWSESTVQEKAIIMGYVFFDAIEEEGVFQFLQRSRLNSQIENQEEENEEGEEKEYDYDYHYYWNLKIRRRIWVKKHNKHVITGRGQYNKYLLSKLMKLQRKSK